MQKFGEKLRRLRQKRGISIRGLSREFGFRSHSYISRIETGKTKPSIEFISKVADFFEVTTEQLVKDKYEVDSA